MKFARQSLLPYPAHSRRAPSSGLPTRPPRVVVRGPSRPSAVARALARTDLLAASHGKSFAFKRIRHAVELAGSCMLIALLVVLVLFG